MPRPLGPPPIKPPPVNNQPPSNWQQFERYEAERNEKDECMSRGGVLETGDPEKPAHPAEPGTRTKTRNLLMFELRLQFYQRNDINLKALRGLLRIPRTIPFWPKRVKGGNMKGEKGVHAQTTINAVYLWKNKMK